MLRCSKKKSLACPEISFKSGVFADKFMPLPEGNKGRSHISSGSHTLLLTEHNIEIATALKHISKQAAWAS